MISGNSLTQAVLSSHTFRMDAKREIASVEAEELFLDFTLIFGLHYSDFSPEGQVHIHVYCA